MFFEVESIKKSAQQRPAVRRLKKEINDLALLFNSKPWMVGVELVKVADEFDRLLLKIPGPVGSPYVNSFIYQLLTYPIDFPFKPPKCKVLSQILNPWIYQGAACNTIDIPILRREQWSPAIWLPDIIQGVIYCLQNLEEHEEGDFFWKRKEFESQEDYKAKAKEISESNINESDEIMIKIFNEPKN